jgi:hypothetical protein
MEENVVLTEVEKDMFDPSAYKDTRFLRPTDTAECLKNLFWQEFELSRMVAGWVMGVPNYEMKLKLGRFAYLHNRNMKCLHDRIKELPVPFNDTQAAPALYREAFERVSMAASHYDFLVSYLFVLKRLHAEYDELMDRLDPVCDAPTVDQLKIVFIERHDMENWVKQQVQFANVDQADDFNKTKQWGEYVAVVWHLFEEGKKTGKNADQIAWPAHPVENPAGPIPEDSAWDPRFPLYEHNAAKDFEGALQPNKNFSDPLMSPLFESVKQMIYINATEIGPAEALCYAYYGVQNMPFEFYYDLARHMWDEFRHTEMGVRRLKQLGYSTEQFKFLKGSPGRKVTDKWLSDMYAALTMIAEPCSFLKKRKSAEAFWKFGDALSAIQTEFDICDERTHVDFGKKWGPELYKQMGQTITAKELAEKTRIRRMEELAVVSSEEIKKVVKNFPMFCGFSTQELNYGNY